MTKTQVCILLVEDDEVDRMACRRALAQHPVYEFTILEADTGRRGIELALAQKPDCVLLDYHLPDLDGLEFLAELRRETGEIPVPVMMLTGADNVGVAVEAMKRGARDYLVKDTNRHYLELLPAVIERVLRERQVLAEKARTQAQLREAEAKYRTLVEQIPAIAYIAALDVPGSLLYISPQIRQLGFSPEEWLADPERLLKQLHPEDRARVREEIAQCYESGVSLRSEYRLLTRTGEGRWFLDEASLVRDESGEPLFLQGVLVDITRDKEVEEELRWHRRRLEELVAKRTAQLEKQTKLLESANANLTSELAARRRAEQAMRASEERFRLLLESTGEAIYGLDTEGRCNFINEAALKMLGYTRDELLGQPTHERIHHSRADGSPYPAGDCPIYDAFRKGSAMRTGVETLWRKDGSSFPAEYSSYPIRSGERITGAVLVFRDVTEAQAMAQQLSHQATHDLLTGLVNRREFERRLVRVLANARADHVDDAGEGVGTTPGMGEVDRAGSQRSRPRRELAADDARDGVGRPRREPAVEDAALCYLDLDQFKVVNDTCGHAAGDELLRLISALLQEKMRHRDTLARVGGDEFGILLEHCPLDQALRIANELREAVQDFQFVWQGRTFSVGVSIGVVALTAATESLASALSAADAACYVAKQKGRNHVHVHELGDVELAAHDA